ncbi:unnamed protein product [Caretta caretta]
MQYFALVFAEFHLIDFRLILQFVKIILNSNPVLQRACSPSQCDVILLRWTLPSLQHDAGDQWLLLYKKMSSPKTYSLLLHWVSTSKVSEKDWIVLLLQVLYCGSAEHLVN